MAHRSGCCVDRNERKDDGLARQAAAGDAEAFAVLLERHYERIYRVAARVLGDTVEAGDVAQDVCVGLPVKLASYRGTGRFTTWLYRVVVNAARDALRRSAARQRNERRYAESEALVQTDAASTECESLWLRRAFGALPEELRITVTLVLEEDLRHADAGAVLGVSESTVSWRMHEVRKRLRALAAAEETVR